MMGMNVNTYNSILVVFGFSLIAWVIYLTGNPMWIWSILLIGMLVASSTKHKEKGDDE
jgi:Flp pilus assembly protein TadB